MGINMATEDIKDFLFQQTGIPQSQWKRLSKQKSFDGEVRVFQAKSNGMTLETFEDKDGVISILDDSNDKIKVTGTQIDVSAVNNKKAQALIKKYYLNGTVPDEDKPGFAQIPNNFKFCFLEDSNPDHSETLEEAAKAGDRQVAVTGFTVFFSPTFHASEDTNHLGPLLEPFLPYFLTEVEEMAFAVHAETVHTYDEERIEGLKDGTIPSIPYDRLIATLEKAGFTYEAKKCMLASLGGSQGAAPFEEEKVNEKASFCLVAVINPKHKDDPTYYAPYITALVVDTPKKTSREQKENLVRKTLKKYGCFYPGRLMNGMLPHIELIQLGKKKSTGNLDEKNWEEIYNILTEAGWEENTDLASLENAKKWTLEQWAVTPMKKDPFIQLAPSSVSDHESAISYYVWKPTKPNLKP
jgi:hypothetical protein